MAFTKLKEKLSKTSKKQKIFAIVIGIVILINIALGIVAISIYRTKSALQLEIYNQTEFTKLKALNKGARKGFIDAGSTAYFEFTDEQLEILNKMFSENHNIALTVRVKPYDRNSSKSETSFRYGFLLENDFDKKGKLTVNDYPDNTRTLVLANLSKAPDAFDVSFALKNKELSNNTLPKGFFINSQVPLEIMATCIVPLELGFDTTSDVPFYGFSSNGGVINFSNTSFDFSGAPLVFPTKTTENSSLPEIVVKLSPNPLHKSSLETTVKSTLMFGGEKVRIKNVKPAESVVIPTGGLKTPFSNMKIDSNEMCITAVIMRPTYNSPKDGLVLKPIITDPGLILNYNTDNWRCEDYELFEWDRYHKILFFDMKDYAVQDNFFRRMAYFVEKKGYQGKLLTNEQLEGKHGYNAHDYSAISMANFFNKATELNFPLNKEELLLKEILIENDLLERDGDLVKANEGGLVSISQESAGWLRDTFLAHEGWHTIFFRDEEFRNFVSAVYYTMDSYSHDFIIDYFASQPQLGYDPNDDYLMKNEFMAYIMQQPLSEVPNYFVHLANRGSVMSYTPELSAYIRETNAAGVEDAAIALNDFVFDKYGIVCGNICLVSR